MSVTIATRTADRRLARSGAIIACLRLFGTLGCCCRPRTLRADVVFRGPAAPRAVSGSPWAGPRDVVRIVTGRAVSSAWASRRHAGAVGVALHRALLLAWKRSGDPARRRSFVGGCDGGVDSCAPRAARRSGPRASRRVGSASDSRPATWRFPALRPIDVRFRRADVRDLAQDPPMRARASRRAPAGAGRHRAGGRADARRARVRRTSRSEQSSCPCGPGGPTSPRASSSGPPSPQATEAPSPTGVAA